MRVLLVNDCPPGISGSGGVETHVRQLKKALTECGLTVALLASQKPGQAERIEEDFFLIPDLDLPPLRKHALDNRLKQRAALKRAEKLIRRFRPDVIHVHNFINPAVLHLLRRCGPVVKSLHDVRPFCIKPPPITASRLIGDTAELCVRDLGLPCFFCCYAHSGKTLTDRLASWTQFPANLKSRSEILKYSRIVTYGTYLRNLASRRFPDPDRIHIINLFTEAEDEAAGFEILPHDEPVFLFAGRFSFEKGLLHIFQALEKIPEVSCRVILAGDGPLRNEVESLARAASPRHKIELPGFVNQALLYELYSRSSVLLFPSIGSEGCGLVGLESMYFGNTAIGYDTGGAGEWLVNGETGIRVERGDVDALAKAMARLATHPEETARLRVQARNYVRTKFKRKAHVNQLIGVYEQALSDRRTPAYENR